MHQIKLLHSSVPTCVNTLISMRKIVLLFSLLLGCIGKQYAQSPVDIHGNLQVSGNQILNQYGEAVSLAGMSMFWSNTNWGGEAYYTSEVVDWLVEDWGITVIRAAMGVEASGGYIWDASNKDRVKLIVEEAIAKGIYVIIDWHSHHAEDYEDEAIAFFEEMATLYGEYPNVIYEIYNEPVQISWPDIIKPYAEQVIDAIRQIDEDNLIVVGNPTWSQDVDVVSWDPIVDEINIAYSLHFYAATHGQYLRDKAQVALDNGIALFVTEWGTVSANGDGQVNEFEVNAWMDFLCENGISHCNWSVNDKLEGASILVDGASTTGGWTEADYTPSGLLVKDIIQDWCLSVDLNNENQSMEYQIFPSPVADEVYIHGEGIERIRVIDLSGQVLLNQAVTPNQRTVHLDVQAYRPGLYIIELHHKYRTYTKKMIKQ